MAPLLDCPDELLLQITQHLDSQSLLKLMRTCRRVRPVAQEALYCSIVVPPSSNDFDPPLACLLRTLIQRPSLANLVREVWFAPRKQYVPVDLPGQTTLERFHPHVDVTMWEPGVVAAIISLAPKLVNLSVFPCGQFPTHSPMVLPKTNVPPVSIIREMFRSRQNRDGLIDIATLQPYQNLKHVRLCTRILEHEWIKLPNLESLLLCHHTQTFWSGNDPPPANSRMSRLELELNFDILLPVSPGTLLQSLQPTRNLQLHGFLLLFPNLKDLLITLYTPPGLSQHNIVPLSFDNLIAKIPATGRLETLNIRILTSVEDVRTFEHIFPLSNVAKLSALRVLEIPQAALGSQEGPINLEDILPVTLEVLTVHRVDDSMLRWIKRIIAERHRLPNLRRIDLYLIGVRSAEYVGLICTYMRSEDMWKLLEVGIEVDIWWRLEEFQTNWQNIGMGRIHREVEEDPGQSRVFIAVERFLAQSEA
ncbi:hypothetical protein N0V83_001860 [Neocucurbitaria cava]|uniref:F-box domain-containing protein n=1 Tax=Neocucurbitaria cava TaxID=798079 RepID=A0A9W9CQD4_9PLEO|nr:hypothetical protein N0V83_001860 [Neocucurbitaria cava]